MAAVEISLVKPQNAHKSHNLTNLKTSSTSVAYLNGKLKPEDVILTKNGSVYLKRFSCRVCHYRAAWESEMVRHETRVHGLDASKKKPVPFSLASIVPVVAAAPRPIPNLIPIQNNNPNNNNVQRHWPPNKSSSGEDSPLSEKDLNDICAKSCPTSALKDFASVIGEETFADKDGKEEGGSAKAPPSDFKKKNATFFDKLKEKLMGEGAGNLKCWCGHKSKCLSEAAAHKKQHENGETNFDNKVPPAGTEMLSTTTRCQHCRQRCKTSADLYVHSQSCPGKKAAAAAATSPKRDEDGGGPAGSGSVASESLAGEDGNSKDSWNSRESRVFVWNTFSEEKEEGEGDEEFGRGKRAVGEGYGFGGLVPRVEMEDGEAVSATEPETTRKQVYSCPHCTFWATTASRFHVHIVGHLNKKPFECSLCAYRSNWRWDITKHIRLKRVRDPSHATAKVLMTDETGRRNYTKYNKYLVMMDVPEMEDGSPNHGNSASPTQPRKKLSPFLTATTTRKWELGMAINGDSFISTTAGVGQKRRYDETENGEEEGGGGGDEEPPKKKVNDGDGKRTMWKCKKCSFRAGDRAVVLAHVKDHYKSNNNGAESNNVVVGGGSKIENKGNNGNDDDDNNGHSGSSGRRTTILRCESCCFETADEGVLNVHNSYHVDNDNFPYRCCFCPMFGTEKSHILSHLTTHGIQNPDAFVNLISRMNDGDEERKCEEMRAQQQQQPRMAEHQHQQQQQRTTTLTPMMGTTTSTSKAAAARKRFKCLNCPYVTNNKSQFLYHRQFHRPREGQFKCDVCSYSVSKRHLLHQHTKIHEEYRSTNDKCEPNAAISSGGGVLASTVVDTNRKALAMEIKLVWVKKGPQFLKKFKCPHCMYVNSRRSGVMEHAKLHTRQGMEGAHACPECNFLCTSSVALATHCKVHASGYGQVCALADPNVSDESQIAELNKLTDIWERNDDKGGDDNGMMEKFQDAAGEQDEGRVLYFCQECPARFMQNRDLETHRKFHNNFQPFGCSSCTYSARHSSHLCAHNKVHMDEYQERTRAMCAVVEASKRWPKPKTVVVESEGSWVVERDGAVVVSGYGMEASDAVVGYGMSAAMEGGTRMEWSEADDLALADLADVTRANFADLAEVRGGGDEDGDDDIITTAAAVCKTSLKAPPTKQFACDMCPAKFFKSMALQYHATLHGSGAEHKCRCCDYAVKTLGNLIKHESVHEQLPPRVKNPAASRRRKAAAAREAKRAAAGLEFKIPRRFVAGEVAAEEPSSSSSQRNAGDKAAFSAYPATMRFPGNYSFVPAAAGEPAVESYASTLRVDPEFGLSMHGNPQFVYPTMYRNGKVKGKRYKCPKCPSAFEKRDQYKVHLSLHGSKQRYRCGKCDYSVKYYANFSQHLKKHAYGDTERRCGDDDSGGGGGGGVFHSAKTSEESEEGGEAEAGEGLVVQNGVKGGGGGDGSSGVDEANALPPPVTFTRASKTLRCENNNNNNQIVAKGATSPKSPYSGVGGGGYTDTLHRCQFCPYANMRKDSVARHELKHTCPLSGSHVCPFCTYATPQTNVLREHQKVHFSPIIGVHPVAYVSYDSFELWGEREGKSGRKERRLLFQDNGSSDEGERFYTPGKRASSSNNNNNNNNNNNGNGNGNNSGIPSKRKRYVNPDTGEVITVAAGVEAAMVAAKDATGEERGLSVPANFDAQMELDTLTRKELMESSQRRGSSVESDGAEGDEGEGKGGVETDEVGAMDSDDVVDDDDDDDDNIHNDDDDDDDVGGSGQDVDEDDEADDLEDGEERDDGEVVGGGVERKEEEVASDCRENGLEASDEDSESCDSSSTSGSSSSSSSVSTCSEGSSASSSSRENDGEGGNEEREK